MKLSRKKAIQLCIELWTWCTRTGKDKDEWPKWSGYEDYNISKGSSTLHDCWFCEYDHQRRRVRTSIQEKCYYCPYHKRYGYCYEVNKGLSYYKLWEDAETPKNSKKYAKLFLGQIKKCV